jgi:hypothetical protein
MFPNEIISRIVGHTDARGARALYNVSRDTRHLVVARAKTECIQWVMEADIPIVEANIPRPQNRRDAYESMLAHKETIETLLLLAASTESLRIIWGILTGPRTRYQPQDLCETWRFLSPNWIADHARFCVDIAPLVSNFITSKIHRIYSLIARGSINQGLIELPSTTFKDVRIVTALCLDDNLLDQLAGLRGGLNLITDAMAYAHDNNLRCFPRFRRYILGRVARLEI